MIAKMASWLPSFIFFAGGVLIIIMHFERRLFRGLRKKNVAGVKYVPSYFYYIFVSKAKS
jgi:hypothetical protein